VTPQTVRVWIIDLDQPRAVVDALRAHLDDAEVVAGAARRDDTVRNRYVVAHGALREILGACLAVRPEAIVISRQCNRCGDPQHGKPELPGSAISFSLSHSHSFAVVAVAMGTRVGVDIEVIRPRARLDALAHRVLSPAEHAEWLDYAPTAQLRAFLERWTAKEAYLKATGAGISVPLRDVPLEPEGWSVISFPSPPDTVARVAAEGYATVHVETWSPPGADGSRNAPLDSTRPIDKFRTTAVGSVFAAGMLGLRDVLEPERDDKVAIVQDYAGAPPFTDPIVMRLDPEHPEDSIVMVRPWLRNPPADNPPADKPPAPNPPADTPDAER
jgi:phosphopantetheinyl transferase